MPSPTSWNLKSKIARDPAGLSLTHIPKLLPLPLDRASAPTRLMISGIECYEMSAGIAPIQRFMGSSVSIRPKAPLLRLLEVCLTAMLTGELQTAESICRVHIKSSGAAPCKRLENLSPPSKTIVNVQFGRRVIEDTP
jgi:hypothetical protein